MVTCSIRRQGASRDLIRMMKRQDLTNQKPKTKTQTKTQMMTEWKVLRPIATCSIRRQRRHSICSKLHVPSSTGGVGALARVELKNVGSVIKRRWLHKSVATYGDLLTPFVPNYTFHPASVGKPDINQPKGFHESDLWQPSIRRQRASGETSFVPNYIWHVLSSCRMLRVFLVRFSKWLQSVKKVL